MPEREGARPGIGSASSEGAVALAAPGEARGRYSRRTGRTTLRHPPARGIMGSAVQAQ